MIHFVADLQPGTWAASDQHGPIWQGEVGPNGVVCFDVPIAIGGHEITLQMVGGISSVEAPPAPVAVVVQRAPPWWRRVLEWFVGLLR